MATMQNFQDLVSAFNAETDRLAAKIDEIMGQVANNGLSSADEEAVLTSLGAVKDRLSSLGADVSNPVPEQPIS